MFFSPLDIFYSSVTILPMKVCDLYGSLMVTNLSIFKSFSNQCFLFYVFKQVCASHRPAHAWFLHVCVSPPEAINNYSCEIEP